MSRGSENEDAQVEAAVRAAARVVIDAVLDLLQADPHQWSARPCGTCTSISGMTGRDFGCVHYAKTGKRS